MPFTITPAPATGAYLTTNLRHVDSQGEPINKGNILYNSEGRIQLAMRAYEGLTQAAIVRGTMTQSFVISDTNTVPTALGQYPKAGDFALLIFEREHPVASMAGTYIRNEFMIVAPHPDIVDTDSKTLFITAGETFETATTRPEALGALINWLEDALVVTVLNVRYPGGWSWIGSRLGGLDKQYDGV